MGRLTGRARRTQAELKPQGRAEVVGLSELTEAREAETRARRIAQFVEVLAKGEKPHR